MLDLRALNDAEGPISNLSDKFKASRINRQSHQRHDLNRLASEFTSAAQMQESYILLSPIKSLPAPQSPDERGNLSHRLKVANRLFDVISGTSEIDHPMCQDCSEEMLIKLEKRLVELRNEKDVYAGYLDKIKEMDVESNAIEPLHDDIPQVQCV